MKRDILRGRTVDRGPPAGDSPPLGGRATDPLTIGVIGPNRSILPDGSMLCRNVPIARTGWMMYGPGEVPIPPPERPGASPVIYIHRGPEELFSEKTMRSFVGCAITNEHPPVNVTPQNFAHLGKGFVLNVFRGEGDDSDCLMADLVVKDQWVIERINQDTREVSCGYDADYIHTGDGEGHQANIIGNHLALVEKGRCGPRCAIGDEDTLSTTDVNEETMTQQAAKPGQRARIPLAEARQRVADSLADLEVAEQEEQQKGVVVHVHMPGSTEVKKEGAETTPPTASAPTMDKAVEEKFGEFDKRIGGIEGTVKEILEAVKGKTNDGTQGGQQTPPAAKVDEPQDGEDPEKVDRTATTDSAALANSYQALVSNAEVLAPGFKLPTFDAAMKRHATVDRMCAARRMVLAQVAGTQDGAAFLKSVNDGKDVDTLGASCVDIATCFNAAAAAKKALNNRSATGDAARAPQQNQPGAPKVWTPAAANEAATKYWAGRNGQAGA